MPPMVARRPAEAPLGCVTSTPGKPVRAPVGALLRCTAEAREVQTVEPVSTTMANDPHDPMAGVPRWPAAVALLVVGGLLSLASSQLHLGPWWLPLVVVLILLVPLQIASRRNLHGKRRALAMVLP